MVEPVFCGFEERRGEIKLQRSDYNGRADLRAHLIYEVNELNV